MDKKIKNSVKHELEIVKRYAGNISTVMKNPREKPSEKYYNAFVKKTVSLVEYLADSPQSPAQIIAKKFHMQKDEIELAYALIQRSRAVSDYLKRSYNGDYFTVVEHYFNKRMLVIVFFVGLGCPCRCLFCPNVTINDNGTRKLVTYKDNSGDLLDAGAITNIFKDMALLKKQGIDILVKISGGLEPFTDARTVTLILEQAGIIDVPVKIFTNGVLLDSEYMREIALKSGDVRISLSSINEQQYKDVLFGNTSDASRKYSLQYLTTNMDNLVKERNIRNLKTRIGINTVILEENHRHIKEFVVFAEKLGLDYIDFKPNYFLPYSAKIWRSIKNSIREIKEEMRNDHTALHLYFADSLSEKNLFWRNKDGYCSPHKQVRFKLFISPHGLCTPVHYGAFPSAEEIESDRKNIYCCGTISSGLSQIIGNESELPPLENDKLNPFELMLSLELEREESDMKWGIPFDFNPYRFSGSNVMLPDNLINNQALQNL